MRNIALALLLGMNLMLSQAIIEDVEEEIEYIEEYEDDVGTADSTAKDNTPTKTSNTTDTANDDEAMLVPLDEDEFAEDVIDDGEAMEVSEESTDDESDESDESDSGWAVGNTDDTSDITRWHYTEEEIAKKEKIRQRQAEREAEYAKSLTRRRSGLFFGLGMGFSDTNLKDLGGVLGGSMLGMSGEIDVTGIGVGGFAGWQQAFNEYSGIRAYGEFDYNLGNGIIVAKTENETIKADNNIWKALGNIDFYLEGNMGRNQTETLGVFFGLGAGYIYYKGGKGKDDNGNEVTWQSLHMIGLVVNYGIHTILGTNHRLELFVRNYPFIRVQTGKNYTTDSFTSNIDAWIRYSFMF